MQVIINPKPEKFNEICKRPIFDSDNLVKDVKKIINEIQLNGDVALKEHTSKFDNVNLEKILVD